MANNKILYSLGFGGITFIITYTYALLFFVVFKTFANDDNYNVAKNILILFLLLSTISLINFKYQNVFFDIKSLPKRSSFLQFFFKTFSVGVFPIVLYTLYTEMYYRKKRENVALLANIVNKKYEKDSAEKSETEVKGNNKTDVLIFEINKLIYVTSEKNYTSFFLETENGITEKILRTTMTQVENELDSCASIHRCHKSYIINSQYVEKITGNARGYQLHMINLEFSIPVSRNFSKNILAKLSSSY